MTESKLVIPNGSSRDMEYLEQAKPDDTVYSVSSLIYRDNTMTRILLGVRRATPTSLRHPGVLSTPTMCLPRSIFESVAGPGATTITAGSIKALRNERRSMIGQGLLGDADAYIIEHLMARKLGLASALTMGRIRASASPASITADEVPDPLGTGMSEFTIMINYTVVLSLGAGQIPAASDCYSRLIWADTNLVSEAVRAKDALLVDDSLNPFEVCIDGLCVRSAAYDINERRTTNVG